MLFFLLHKSPLEMCLFSSDDVEQRRLPGSVRSDHGTFCPSFRRRIKIHQLIPLPVVRFSSSAALPPRRFILRGVLRRHTPNGSRPLRKRSRLFPTRPSLARSGARAFGGLLRLHGAQLLLSNNADNAMCASDCVCLDDDAMILLLLVVRQNVVVVETLFCVEDPRDKKSSSSSSPSFFFPYNAVAAADADQTCSFWGSKERKL